GRAMATRRFCRAGGRAHPSLCGERLHLPLSEVERLCALGRRRRDSVTSAVHKTRGPSSPTVAASSPFDDADLLRAVAREDLTALGMLFDRHYEQIRRVLLRSGVSAADTDDVVQATFMQVVKTAASYDGRASSAAWLCGIALRLAARHRRSAARLLRALMSFAEEAPSKSVITPESE